MTTTPAARPVCVYAKAALKRNSNRMLVVMCVGIALALYGGFVANRMRVNSHYAPTIAAASHWLNNRLAQAIGYPMSMFGSPANCHLGGLGYKETGRTWMMNKMVRPIISTSGFVNGIINVSQIILLKVYCSSMKATDAIIGLSMLGMTVSMICLVGSFFTCKMMCLSCVGIQHMLIIYLGFKRRQILYNIMCPSELAGSNQGSSSTGSGIKSTSMRSSYSANCSIGGASNSGGASSTFGAAIGRRNANPQASAGRRRVNSSTTNNSSNSNNSNK